MSPSKFVYRTYGHKPVEDLDYLVEYCLKQIRSGKRSIKIIERASKGDLWVVWQSYLKIEESEDGQEPSIIPLVS